MPTCLNFKRQDCNNGPKDIFAINGSKEASQPTNSISPIQMQKNLGTKLESNS